MSPEALIFPISHLLKDLSHSAVANTLTHAYTDYRTNTDLIELTNTC